MLLYDFKIEHQNITPYEITPQDNTTVKMNTYQIQTNEKTSN